MAMEDPNKMPRRERKELEKQEAQLRKIERQKRKERRARGEIDYNEMPTKVRIRPYAIIAPGLLILIGIMIPFLVAIFLSLTNYSFKMPKWKFVGLKNWINMFTDGSFYHSLWVTLKYAFFATLAAMLIGTCIALLLRKDTKYARILKVLYTFPLMVAPAIAVLIWQLMTSNTVGVLEKFMNVFGIYNFPWASSHNTAMFTAVLIDCWVNTPFVILLVQAGTQSLPKSPFEAAQVDGASSWFTFKTLTFPMLKPYMYIALLFRLMAALQEFGIIYALTKGGPGDTLMSISMTSYLTAFQFQKLGEALPMLIILWVIVNYAARFIVKRQRFLADQAAGR